MWKIIAITGLRRSGKDEIANYLSRQYGYTNMKIASSLKTVVKALFHMSEDQVEGATKEIIDTRWGITPRQALQFVGTELLQFKIQELLPHIGRSFWIRQFCEGLDLKSHVAISDVRFHHEVEELERRFPGRIYIIKVVRDQALVNFASEHSSEREWQTIREDALIENNGTLSDLYTSVDRIVSQM